MKRRILMIMEQCNPEWASVPLVAYNWYSRVRELAEVTLVTHERNRPALEKVRAGHAIDYIPESRGAKAIYCLASRVTQRGGVNWPLQHALAYPVYGQFNRRVYERYAGRAAAGAFELVHAMTPVLPRYPVKMVRACRQVPFILGPVNGGVPFPEGFRAVGRKEFAHFNFLRRMTRLIPGYAATYRQADCILAGSKYTQAHISRMFGVGTEKIPLVHENGVSAAFIQAREERKRNRIELLFTGRLVPYKGADMAIEAVSLLEPAVRENVCLTIVGDGPERGALESLAASLGVGPAIRFTGWVPQAETRRYYRRADLFFFPSVREFGGAVVLEAMASGLPCIVADHAGPGEYVTAGAGIKIKPRSRRYLVSGLAAAVTDCYSHPEKMKKMSAAALARALGFEWNRKAEQLVTIYESLIAGNAAPCN